MVPAESRRCVLPNAFAEIVEQPEPELSGRIARIRARLPDSQGVDEAAFGVSSAARVVVVASRRCRRIRVGARGLDAEQHEGGAQRDQRAERALDPLEPELNAGRDHRQVISTRRLRSSDTSGAVGTTGSVSPFAIT